MDRLSVRDMKVTGKKVFIRVDFNVPLKDGSVADDTKIRAAIPTINYLLGEGAAIILASHLGRPGGRVVEELRLDPVARVLEEILHLPVQKLDDCIGAEVREKVAALESGDILLLENLRFHPEEEKNDSDFSRELAALSDFFVNDAFATAHRAHASTAGITAYLPSVAGLLMEKELACLGGILMSPTRPLVAIIGGAKVAGKIDLLHNLLDIVDVLLIGGGMANTFLKARGFFMGTSLLEEDKVSLAQEVMARAEKKGIPLVLPQDFVVARELKEQQETMTVTATQLPEGYMALDIGPATIRQFAEYINTAGTLVWNGPLGAFEVDPFNRGTAEIAREVAASSTVSIIGGGDVVAALHKAGLAEKMTHISTGGGATLEYLEGKSLPGVEALLGLVMK